MLSSCEWTLFLSLSELKIRQEKGVICSEAAILAVDDPKPGIGSGSATLNALISVTESLAAQEGHKVRGTSGRRFDRWVHLLTGGKPPVLRRVLPNTLLYV